MGNQTGAYRKLAKRYGVARSEPFLKVLNALITSEEAEILLELKNPMTIPELAKKVAIDETQLQKMLDDMTKRGVIRSVKDGYTLPPHIMLMCHWT